MTKPTFCAHFLIGIKPEEKIINGQKVLQCPKCLKTVIVGKKLEAKDV